MIFRRLFWMLVLFLGVGWLYFKSQTLMEAYNASESIEPSREPLFLPEDFDNSYQIDTQTLEKVKDYTVLDNDQRRWDRGFWPCLEAAIKLSPEEISRRAQTIDFENINEDTPKDQAYRDALRGKWIQIKGYYQPDSTPYLQLPQNPTGRQLMRLGVVGQPQGDLFRLNVPEAWLVYFLDDSIAHKGDYVEVEGIFFKVMKFTSKKNNQTYYLPTLIARSPKILQTASSSPSKESLITTKTVKWVALGTILLGISLLVVLSWKRYKKTQFKNEVLKKIKNKAKK